MIKDIILHLERDSSRDIVCDFAASTAEMFAAHLTGVSFAFAASIPNYIVPNFPQAFWPTSLQKVKQRRAAQSTASRPL